MRRKSGSSASARPTTPSSAARSMAFVRYPGRRRAATPGVMRGIRSRKTRGFVPEKQRARALQGRGFALALCGPLRLEPLHPAPDQLALERADVIDEQLADQMIHLVLHADGEQVVRRLETMRPAVATGEVDHDAAEARDLFILVRDGETALRVAELAVGVADDGIDEPEQAFAPLPGRFAFLRLLLDVHDDHVLVHADLRGRKADAV